LAFQGKAQRYKLSSHKAVSGSQLWWYVQRHSHTEGCLWLYVRNAQFVELGCAGSGHGGA
jgi:hypothetical protein